MKQVITFEKGKCSQTIAYKEKPVINIIDVRFTTPDNEWVNRLYNASIKVKIQKFDSNNNSLGFSEDPLSLGQFISTNHRQAVLTVNKSFRSQIQTNNQTENCTWQVSINLTNIELLDIETVAVSILDTEYITKRVADWEERILNLYSEVRSWVRSDSGYSFREGKIAMMHEGLMKEFEVPPKPIPTLDLFHNDSLKLSFKPKGLWIMGANGRIDILSLKTGGLILIDKAENFQPPQWYLVENTNRDAEKKWSKELFSNLISA